jgi:hypothetical protein
LNSAFIDAVSVPFTDAREEISEMKNEIKPEEFFNYDQQQELHRKIEKSLYLKYVINLMQTLEKKAL